SMTRKLAIGTTLALALGFLAATPAWAAAPAPASASQRHLSAADKDFMMKAAQGAIAEIELGGVAMKRGGKDGKTFGQRMVTDHTKSLNSLKSLAASLRITLPTKPTADQL